MYVTQIEHVSEFRFYAELNDFLKPSQARGTFAYRYHGTPAVKDAVEALGVPHTEVDLILVNGASVGFGYRLKHGDRVAVYPVFESLDIAGLTHLRPRALRKPRFICDVHLGRLARRLRLLGFDVSYSNSATGPEIVAEALAERRIIVTRDRGILKQRAVTHGYLVRSARVAEQVVELLDRFDLRGQINPFSRCARCNGMVKAVAKQEVVHKLPPRTRQHYKSFRRCRHCGAIYWRGAHVAALGAWIAEVKAGVPSNPRLRCAPRHGLGQEHPSGHGAKGFAPSS